jgi:hypothetical protein
LLYHYDDECKLNILDCIYIINDIFIIKQQCKQHEASVRYRDFKESFLLLNE